MPSEKRALDTDQDRYSKKSRREDDQPRDWRAAYFEDGSTKRKNRDQDPREKGFGREKERDRSYDRPRDKDRLYRSGHEPHGSSLTPRPREMYETTPDGRKDSLGRGPPTAPKAMLQPPSLTDEREEGEISPRPADSVMVTDETSPREPLPDLELSEDKSAEDDAEARRARRAAILAKYQANTASDTPHLSANNDSLAVDPLTKLKASASGVESVSATPPPSTPYRANTGTAPSPVAISQEDGSFLLTKESTAMQSSEKGLDVRAQVDGGVEGVAAADYDPSQDMRDDVRKAAQLANDTVMADGSESEYEEEEADDVDDMFAIVDEDAEKKPKKKKKKKKIVSLKKPLAIVPDTMDTAADEEGYYQIILGEPLDGGRYKVYALVGKGMFSNVVRAREYDLQSEDKEKPVGEVCIKIVRSQESMYKAGLKEVQILQKLRQGDPEDKKHLVKMERTFEHRGHLCLVFESLSMNLRDTVKKYGRDIGLHLKAVRVYSHQLFLALSLLRKCNILHADIKPDNILINESRSNLKLCDLGSAADVSFENTAAAITPYLVSRFYRAPEIILGMPYDCPVDVWSIGCTLYELYTGRILFPGRSNREMLKLMMELKGRFNQKALKKAKFGNDYFDEGGGFWDATEGGGMDMSKKLHFTKPTRDLRARLVPNSRAVEEVAGEEKELLAFVDLLDKCLQLDATRRITPKEALNHPFIRGI